MAPQTGAVLGIVVELAVREGALGVDRGGAEQDHAYIQRQQIRGGEEHLFPQRGQRLEHEVHRPVSSIGIDLVEPAGTNVVSEPAGHLKLRRGRQHPQRHQSEQHPLHLRHVELATLGDLGNGLIDPEPVPQLIEHARYLGGEPQVPQQDLCRALDRPFHTGLSKKADPGQKLCIKQMMQADRGADLDFLVGKSDHEVRRESH